MNLVLTLAIPCRADEPGLAGTLDSLWEACQHPDLRMGLPIELVICLNGVTRGQHCAPLTMVRDFCARHGIAMEEVWENEGDQKEAWPACCSPSLPGEEKTDAEAAGAALRRCRVLLTEQVGKPRAWNRLWRRAAGELVIFCDADVRVAADAVCHLLSRLRREPHLRLIAAREVPVLPPGATLWSRMGAIPYRFNFGNAGGRLYLIRKNAFAGEMPEDLLLEDAWLTVAVGKRWVVKEWHARVFFLLPTTWRDYFAERVRTEGGKLQIRRVHAALLVDGPIAQYQWRHFWQGIAVGEYPLVLLALGVRVLARVVAWIALLRKDFYALYRPFASTKGWTAAER
jgi:hypothetical protein